MASSRSARSLLAEIRNVDIGALIEAESRQELLTLVTDDIQSINGAGRTRTMIVLE